MKYALAFKALNRYAIAVGLLLAAGAGNIAAQPYPNRPVRLVVPFPSGGSIDTVARPLALGLADVLGQNVVVDNRGAGNGIVGTDLVAKAPPDGYTVLMTNVAFVITPGLIKKIPYDPRKDFVPVIQLTSLPYLVVTTPSLAANSVQDLIALAKAKPTQITFASLGNGSGSHLTGLLFMNVTGIDLVHVPYKGFGPLAPDLISGRVHVAFNTIPSVLPHVRAGRLRALVLSSKQRSPLLPEVPTSMEAGVPRFDPSTWHGLFAPAGVPASAVATLNAAAAKTLAAADMKERLAGQGAAVVGGSSAQFTTFVHNEIGRWAGVVKASGATVD